MTAMGGGAASAASPTARDVLRERLAKAMALTEGCRPDPGPLVWGQYGDLATAALDALLAHPTELLALLAEPKVCPLDTDGDGNCHACPPRGVGYPGCVGGRVAVDVLDLLGYEQVGYRWSLKPEHNCGIAHQWHYVEGLPQFDLASEGYDEEPVFAAVPKDGTP